MDFDKAKLVFKDYLKNYDLNDKKTKSKIVHTYGVVELSEYIAKDLGLDNENIELAKLIALLHDIGRFEEIRRYDNFVDKQIFDHANFGAKILFEDGMIRDFIEDDKYDSIIKKAIVNHSKYAIEEEGLSEQELLHSKIIRDSDKTDNIRRRAISGFEDISDTSESIIATQTITDKIFKDFMEHKTIVKNERKTFVDRWISYISFIFDYNFSSGLEYIKEKDYINMLVDKIDFQNEETRNGMEQIRECANEYIMEKIFKSLK
ncbi:MAG: HD domain-containing protein [Oscillospiraceae bacterium]|nr:HD domain-containing protein [Oscillospiraceae bacterium]